MFSDPSSQEKNTCVIRDVFSLVSAKWVLPILNELGQGTKRFGELKKALPGISPNTLSMRLQELEKAGIISKKVFPEVPPRVEYSYTRRGERLGEALMPLIQWALDNYDNSDVREFVNRCINKRSDSEVEG